MAELIELAERGIIRGKVKMVAEEGIEFLALGMIFIAVFEFMLFSRASNRQTSSTPPM